MKIALVGAALLLGTASRFALAAPAPLDCDVWASNASIGALRAMLGHPRRLVPLIDSRIGELLVHGQYWQMPGVPVLADQYGSDEDKVFLEDSIFFGFDYARSLPAHEQSALVFRAMETFTRACKDRHSIAAD